MPAIQWDVRLDGRAWTGDEASARWGLTPEKFEMAEGKLFWTEEDRVNLLAMLLENVGVRGAVRIGNVSVWRAAIEEIGRR
jgi:hypothetical protein